VLNDHLINT